MGREAAIEIDHWLMGEAIVRAAPQAPVSAAAINTFYHPRALRAEAIDGLSAEQVVAEAARCFSCGRCTCLLYTSDAADE